MLKLRGRFPSKLGLGLTFAGVAYISLFHALGAFGLLGPDEPRYAEIAAEMAASHNYVTPRLVGQPWFEKPVLYYWLAAASYKIVGISDAHARLPCAVLALLLSLSLAAFLWRLVDWRAGLVSLLICFTSAFMLGFGRAATTDMPLTAMLCMAQLALYLWLVGRERQQRTAQLWLYLAAALLALAVLAKGPVAVVLAGATLFVFLLARHRPHVFLSCFAPLAIAIFCAVALPWYIAVARANPSFVRVFFLEHNLERFATTVYRHPQPFWFFIPVLFLSIFPWSFCAVYPLRDGIEWFRRRRTQNEGAGFSERPNRDIGNAAALKWYLFIWLVVPVLFFSASKSKLPGYILPSVPALIALISVAIAERWPRGAQFVERWPLVLTGASAAVAFWLVALVSWGFSTKSERRPLSAEIVFNAWSGLLLALLLALVLVLVWKRWLVVFGALVGAIVLAAILRVTGPLAGTVDRASARPIATVMRRTCGEGVVVYSIPVCGERNEQWPPPSQACRQVLDGRKSPYPLYGSGLDRNVVYGLNFYLHEAVPDLPPIRQWPARGVALTRGNEAEQFRRRALAEGVQSVTSSVNEWEIVYFWDCPLLRNRIPASAAPLR